MADHLICNADLRVPEYCFPPEISKVRSYPPVSSASTLPDSLANGLDTTILFP